MGFYGYGVLFAPKRSELTDGRDLMQASLSSDDEAGMLLASSGASSARYFSKKKASRNKL